MEDYTSENVVDFIIRNDAYSREYLSQHPEVQLCKVLEGGFAIVFVRLEDVPEFLASIGGTPTVFPTVHGLLGEMDMEVSGIIGVQNHPFLNLRGNGVVLGFVDTGIDYANSAFRYEDGVSKILAIWDQTIPGDPPLGYCYGNEYTKDEINRALLLEDPLSVLPHKDESGHGTFLAAAAGGRQVGETIGAAPDAEIIMVKLKKAKQYYLDVYMVPEGQEHAYECSDIMQGINYMVQKAAELRRPIAICIGLGANTSGHDGFSYYQEYLTGVAMQYGVLIAVAGGNEANAKHHCKGRVAQNEKVDLEIRSGDSEKGFLIHLWTFSQDRMSVSLTSPLGETVGRVPPESGIKRRTALKLEKSVVEIVSFYPLPSTGSQVTEIRIYDPTPGIWTLSVYGDSIFNGNFHLWLPVQGFVDPETVFLSPDPYYTVTCPATSYGTVSCGSYSAGNGSLAVSSSWGPTRYSIQLLDLVAPGVGVWGVFPWGQGVMSGTSVAAAIVAGAGALLLEWGVVQGNEPAMNSINIKAYLTNGCEQQDSFSYPNPQWGYGTLNLMRSFEQMRVR